MSQPHSDKDRLMDLLASYAVQDLSPEEHEELQRLLEQEDGVTPDEFEMAAAAMHLAMSDTPPDTLPDGLADKLVEEANVYFSQQESKPAVSAAPAQTASSSKFHLREGIAWLAAAVALLVALGSQFSPQGPTASEAREELLKLSGTAQVDWKALDDPTTSGQTSGDVVWNTEKQAGFMRIANLGVNDPTAFQYQLWIFDPTQADPIDGGVFDIKKANELIPIDPKLLVRDAVQFAVTVEKPGGVPKSAKTRIPLLAVVGN